MLYKDNVRSIIFSSRLRSRGDILVYYTNIETLTKEFFFVELENALTHHRGDMPKSLCVGLSRSCLFAYDEIDEPGRRILTKLPPPSGHVSSCRQPFGLLQRGVPSSAIQRFVCLSLLHLQGDDQGCGSWTWLKL